MRTPSAPRLSASRTNIGSTRPEHMTLIDLRLAGYLVRLVPARSAPAYEHQLQRNPTMLGSNSVMVYTILLFFFFNYVLL